MALIKIKQVETLQTALDALNNEDTSLGNRVTTLENTILADDEFNTEEFTGNLALGPYTLANSVQDDDPDLIWAYVNGLSIGIDTVSGTDVTLEDPGYTIDANDTIKFQYQAV